jgi:hypothetical protein
MTACELFQVLTRAGCRLRPDGPALRILDPQHALTDPLRAQIRRHKEALLSILCPRPPRHAGGFPITDTEHPCSVCGSPDWQQHLSYRYCLVCGQESGPGMACDDALTQNAPAA